MKNKSVILYTLIAYVWSFGFWLLGFSVIKQSEYSLVFNVDLVELLLNGQLMPEMVFGTLLTILAVYGPLIGVLVIRFRGDKANGHFRKKTGLNWKIIGQSIAVISIIALAPGLLMIGQYNRDVSVRNIVVLLVSFFIFQLLTSGTEEFGWRGFLLPEMMKSNTLWQSCIKVGFIWGFWHTPVVLYMFVTQGMAIPQIITSFIGFIAGIVGMSVIQGYFYNRSRSTLLAVLLHALANTLPLIIGLLASNAYMVAVVSQLMLWVVVIVLSKVKKIEFNQKPVAI